MKTGRPTSLGAFPPEIINEIFHYGCTVSTFFCSSLCQTSKWTRKLALPYFYSTVVIKRHSSTRLLSSALTSKFTPIYPPNPQSSLKDYIKSLWVEAVSNKIVTLYYSCPNLRNIALAPGNVLWLGSSSAQARMTPSFLPMDYPRQPNLHLLLTEGFSETMLFQLPHNWHISLNNEFFNRITHLRIGKIGHYDSLAGVFHYKNLSHIAIPYHCPPNHSLPDLLDLFTFPSVAVLVVVILMDLLSAAQCEEAIAWVRNVRTTNSKIYAVTSLYSNLQIEWEEEARRGLSIWVKAEQFTRAMITRD